MSKLIAFLKREVPPVRKAIVAGIVPLVPSILAFVLQNYGVAAAFAATAVASAAGVYKATNATTADVAGSAVPSTPPSTSPAAA